MTALVRLHVVSILLLFLAFCGVTLAQEVATVDVRAYSTLQAAIDANPGRIIQLPPGEYVIDSALKISADHTELHGPARIVQTNVNEQILRAENANHIRITNISFSRRAGAQDAKQSGIEIVQCRDVELSFVRVSENHTRMSIAVISSRDVTVDHCTVTNYKGLTIDDRTKNEYYGFAFNAIDGTGIQFRDVDGGAIRNNRVQEFRLLPTREIREEYDLGMLTVRPEKRGVLMDQDIFDSGYTNNWHQGAGIHVAVPYGSRRIIISGNFIENAAQGMDIHADNIIIAQNIVSHAMIGMKAMHGAKHVLIDGNQFSHTDLWGLKLMPGAGSYSPESTRVPGQPTGENIDGGTIISNNIFSNFGFGEQYWNWKDRQSDFPERNVIAVVHGQLPSSPPLRNLVISGNLVHNSGGDMVLIEGEWMQAPPRYFYGLYIDQEDATAPRNVHVSGNLLDPGIKGGTNFADVK